MACLSDTLIIHILDTVIRFTVHIIIRITGILSFLRTGAHLITIVRIHTMDMVVTEDGALVPITGIMPAMLSITRHLSGEGPLTALYRTVMSAELPREVILL